MQTIFGFYRRPVQSLASLPGLSTTSYGRPQEYITLALKRTPAVSCRAHPLCLSADNQRQNYSNTLWFCPPPPSPTCQCWICCPRRRGEVPTLTLGVRGGVFAWVLSFVVWENSGVRGVRMSFVFGCIGKRIIIGGVFVFAVELESLIQYSIRYRSNFEPEIGLWRSM